MKPALLFRTDSRLYKRLEEIARMLNVDVQTVVNKMFEETLDNKEFIVETIRKIQLKKYTM